MYAIVLIPLSTSRGVTYLCTSQVPRKAKYKTSDHVKRYGVNITFIGTGNFTALRYWKLGLYQARFGSGKSKENR